MRKIEQKAKEAFYSGNRFIGSNTSIRCIDFSNVKISEYQLYGTTIAEYNHKTKVLKINDAGWQTATTKSRLNSILPHNYFIVQRAYIWYLNIWGKESKFEGFKSIQL